MDDYNKQIIRGDLEVTQEIKTKNITIYDDFLKTDVDLMKMLQEIIIRTKF